MTVETAFNIFAGTFFIVIGISACMYHEKLDRWAEYFYQRWYPDDSHPLRQYRKKYKISPVWGGIFSISMGFFILLKVIVEAGLFWIVKSTIAVIAGVWFIRYYKLLGQWFSDYINRLLHLRLTIRRGCQALFLIFGLLSILFGMWTAFRSI